MLLGAVPYLNAIPLIRGLPYPIRKAPPAVLDRLLQIGELDLATAPVTALFDHPHWCALPGVAIGTKQAARSVALFTRDEGLTWQNVQSIFIDRESRTSALLLRVLLALKYGRDLKTIEFTSESDKPPHKVEAKLLIGDKTLQEFATLPWSGNSYDLGSEWTEWTGLPFVFACWVSTKASLDPRLVEELRRCPGRNLQNLAAWCHEIEGMEASFLEEYFTENMNYGFGRQEQQGLATFYHYLRELEIYSAPFELRFVNPGG